MTKTVGRAGLAVALLGLLVLSYVLINSKKQENGHRSRIPVLQGTGEGRASSFVTAQKGPRPSGKKLPEDVQRLLGEWRDIKRGAKRYQYVEEVCELARRSIKELKCGDKLVMLINSVLLEDDTMDDFFDREVMQILTADSTGLHHKAIASIQSDSKTRFRWSYFAGRGCSGNKLDEFVKLLASSADQESTRLGNLVKSCDKDALAGVKGLIDAKDYEATGVSKKLMLTDAIDAAGEVASFPGIEEAIRGGAGLTKDTANDLRDHLIDKWVVVSPQTLAVHFNEHPDAMSANDACRAIVNVCRTSPEKACELAQHLDLPKHFDAAVLAVLPYVHSKYPQQSLELIQQISTPQDRAVAASIMNGSYGDDINRD